MGNRLAGARPFLKWAGGKSRLLPQLSAYFPAELHKGGIRRYVEPFVGSGAVFFHVASCYPVEEFYLSDANAELILLYRTVQQQVERLIQRLAEMETEYLAQDEDGRRAYYYAIRDRLNAQQATFDYERDGPQSVERSADLIFLNRTGYNGLFRVNAAGEFNVPFGRYHNPTICQHQRLHAAAAVLQRAHIHHGHFSQCAAVVDERTFVYLDPPYRPLSRTAYFTAYSTQTFGDAEQLALAHFFRELDGRGARLMLSNSDPHNHDPSDTFFEDAYHGFRMERVRAGRPINSQVAGRGVIDELLILNW